MSRCPARGSRGRGVRAVHEEQLPGAWLPARPRLHSTGESSFLTPESLCEQVTPVCVRARWGWGAFAGCWPVRRWSCSRRGRIACLEVLHHATGILVMSQPLGLRQTWIGLGPCDVTLGRFRLSPTCGVPCLGCDCRVCTQNHSHLPAPQPVPRGLCRWTSRPELSLGKRQGLGVFLPEPKYQECRDNIE